MSVQDPVFAYARAQCRARGDVVRAAVLCARLRLKPGLALTLLSNRLF